MTYTFEWQPTEWDEPLAPRPEQVDDWTVEYDGDVIKLTVWTSLRDLPFHFWEIDNEPYSDLYLARPGWQGPAVDQYDAAEALEKWGTELHRRLAVDLHGMAVEALSAIRADLIAAHTEPRQEREVVDLVAALRAAVEAAKQRRKEAGR